MIDSRDTGESPHKAGVRRAASAVEDELAALSGQMVEGEDRARLSRLRSSWAQMLAALDLGPAPKVRACSFCGAIGMRAATRCGNCWRMLTQPAPSGEV